LPLAKSVDKSFAVLRFYDGQHLYAPQVFPHQSETELEQDLTHYLLLHHIGRPELEASLQRPVLSARRRARRPAMQGRSLA